MANKRKLSGGEEIANAKKLFFQSIERGEPDFRFAVLAIGQNPATPPSWALWECRFEYERTFRQPSSQCDKTDVMLDEIARAYVVEMARREDNPNLRSRPVPSFREMVRRAYRAVYDQPLSNSTESGPYRHFDRKWKDEQQNAAINSDYELFDWNITPRIEAILDDFVGTEMDLFSDPARAAFIMQALAKGTPNDK